MVHFSERSTVAANCNTETQIEMRDGTVGHFPVVDVRGVDGGQDAVVLVPVVVVVVLEAEGAAVAGPGGNCIKIGLPGKLILSKRKGLREVLFS